MKSARISRSYTLLEMLAVVSLIGTFFLLSGPLTWHLFYAINGRTRTFDQLFLVSRIDDKIRSDLHSQPGEPLRQALAVEPDRMIIGSIEKNIEYRIKNTKNTTIERIESLAAKPRTTGIWEVPYSSLNFSRERGKQDAILVELHWDLRRAGDRFTLAQKRSLEMSFAARESQPGTLTTEKK
jgi:hypothetical protein